MTKVMVRYRAMTGNAPTVVMAVERRSTVLSRSHGYVDLVPGGLASVVRFPKARRVFWCVR